MNSHVSLLPVLLLSLVSWPSPQLLAQEDVTIPKSRLEELERKEKELDRLKGDLNKTKDENAQRKNEKAKLQTKPVTAAAAEPAVAHQSPPIASLPPLKPQELVESLDLATYYHADAQTADQRYRHQKLRVRGEIVGFEKPLFIRSYRVLLKTADRDTKVICDLLPPDNANAVFTSDHGAQLVAMSGDTRTVLAKVGDIAVVKGECKGMHGGAVMLSCWELALLK
jgi:tRNA_anti-like